MTLESNQTAEPERLKNRPPTLYGFSSIWYTIYRRVYVTKTSRGQIYNIDQPVGKYTIAYQTEFYANKILEA